MLTPNRKSHTRFRLIARPMTMDDPDLLLRILSEFRGISQICEATRAKGMKIDPYRQRQRYNPSLGVLLDIILLALICSRFLR